MKGELTLTPVTLREAQAFVNDHHRHNMAPRGHKFSIGLEKDGILIGVCIVGRPIARHNDDGKTAEVLRVCVLEGNRNANSKLYGAAVRACKAMGYTKQRRTLRHIPGGTGPAVHTGRQQARRHRAGSIHGKRNHRGRGRTRGPRLYRNRDKPGVHRNEQAADPGC